MLAVIVHTAEIQLAKTIRLHLTAHELNLLGSHMKAASLLETKVPMQNLAIVKSRQANDSVQVKRSRLMPLDDA